MYPLHHDTLDVQGIVCHNIIKLPFIQLDVYHHCQCRCSRRTQMHGFLAQMSQSWQPYPLYVYNILQYKKWSL